MRRTIKALTLSFALLPTLVMAGEGASFIGTYGINCGAALQCALTITKRRDGHAVAAFVVADRHDYRKMICGLAVPILPTIYHELVGGPDRWELKIREIEGGGVAVSGLPPTLCRIDLNGRYYAIGDK